MGCCLSKQEADAEEDSYAEWTEELPCRCSRQYSFTTSLTWEVVPITIYHCCYGEEEETREAVQAKIECDLCGHQFRRTYELRCHEERKDKRWGHYGHCHGVKAHSTDRFSFAHLEQCYALIEQYFLEPDCGGKVGIEPNNHWAKDFYELVTAGEPNRAQRM